MATVKIKKGEVVIAEIPIEMFPLKISTEIVTQAGNYFEKDYSWNVNFHRDKETKEKTDKVSGMQLS